MKLQLLLYIFLAFAALANAQTIPKSIDKPVTPKTQKTTQKVVVKQKPVYIEKNKDSDGDGIIDDMDNCPNAKGSLQNSGCPEPEKPAIMLPEMVYVTGGTFSMGSDDFYEKPVHQVTVSSFYIGKYEITQAQWQSVMGNNPSSKDCPGCPVESVSWDDVNIFLQKIKLITGKNFRLPTEAEWEYTARGGNNSRGFTYAGSNDQKEVGWSYVNSGSQIQATGLKKANELGLYDMSGNVFEWCKDWKSDYSNSPSTNPQGPSTGSYRVMRGGSWRGSASNCRVSYRNARSPADREDILGFRVVLPE